MSIQYSATVWRQVSSAKENLQNLEVIEKLGSTFLLFYSEHANLLLY